MGKHQSFSIKELKPISTSFLLLSNPHIRQQPPPYENMLANITPDETYQLTARDLLEKVISHFEDEKLAERILSARDTAEPVAGDTFYSMYSYYPMLKQSDKIKNEILRGIRDLFEQWMQTNEYRTLRSVTRLNREASKVFAMRFARTFLQELAKKIPPEQWPKMGGGSGGSGQGSGSGQSGQQRQKQTQQQIEEAVNQAFNKAREEAKKAADNYSKLAGGLGGGSKFDKDPGELAFIDEEPGIDRVEFEEMIKILGSLKKAMPIMFSRNKKPSIMGDVEGYAITRRPEKAIPRELALPDELFYTKLARGGFLAREKRLPERGVMIVLLDKSGSMSGQKMGWAKAVALALAIKAKREGLHYMLIPFDTETYDSIPLKNTQHLKSILKIKAGGGTDITDAIATAVELAERKHYNKANIVVITDGIDDVETKELLPKLKRINASLKAIYIQGSNKQLEELAHATRGQLLTVQPDSQDALRVVKAA